MTQTQLPPPGPYLPLSCPSQPHDHAPVRSPAAPRSQPRFRPGPPSRLRVPPTWRQRWGHVVPGLAFPAATLEPGKGAGRIVMMSRGAAPGPWPRAGAGGGAPWGRRSPTCTGTRGSATWVSCGTGTGAGAGNPVATATAGTRYRRRRRHSLLCTRFRVPAPGVGSAAPRAPQLWAAPCPRCCPPEPFVRALPASPPPRAPLSQRWDQGDPRGGGDTASLTPAAPRLCQRGGRVLPPHHPGSSRVGQLWGGHSLRDS